MAGIAGAVYSDVFQVNHLVDKMINTVIHRGPSSQHFHTHKNFQVGICGQMLSSYGDIVVGLDGALYNTMQLRATLKEKGFPDSNPSDSDLINYAYALWGLSFLEHIDGDFSLFVLDEAQDRLILARDRIGKKPLYWYHDGKQLLFASELKAIVATGSVPQTMALDAMALYLYFGFIPQDFSPIKSVNKLLPGYYLICSKDHSKTIQPYWSYSSCFQNRSSEDRSTVIRHVDEMLQQSVVERIPHEKPIGCMVSGGLGSATVAYYLQKIVAKNEIKAFTVGFQDQTSADLLAAKSITQSLEISQQTEMITPKTFLNDLVRIAWYLDEPLADPNVTATWRLAALSSQTQYVFSGMGSDELMAGHSRYTIDERNLNKASLLRQYRVQFMRMFLPIIQFLSKKYAYGILQQSRTNPWQFEFMEENSIFNQKLIREIAPNLSTFFDPRTFLHKFHNLPRVKSQVGSFLYFDVKTRLPDCYIMQYDRLTAAHSIDWRTPFLARYLIEYLASMSMPEQMESAAAFSTLKSILKDVFSPEVLNRPKKTRRSFLQPWVESSGVGKLFELLPRGSLVDQGLISQKWLKLHTSTPELRRENFRYLWSILMLEIWVRLYINESITENPPQLSVQELFLEI